jgi:hypothetical protein
MLGLFESEGTRQLLESEEMHLFPMLRKPIIVMYFRLPTFVFPQESKQLPGKMTSPPKTTVY